MNWIVAQLGARENYAVARSLHRQGVLTELITDAWAGPKSMIGRLSQRIGERHHAELSGASVFAPTYRAAAREVAGKFSATAGWDEIIERNNWFQRMVASRVAASRLDENGVLFAYSYAAEKILQAAKAKGALTILGQIDPGLAEAKQISAVYSHAGQDFSTPPPHYWDAWKRETEIADIILVNSEWSREGLQSEGVSPDKIRVVPLAIDAVATSRPAKKVDAFTATTPLRLLFLGQVNLRKGIDLLFDAVLQLPDAPIQLDVVGPIQVPISEEVAMDERIILHGSVPRSAVDAFYQDADIFVFPTRSDGFGLTQLEALAAGVPIVASSACGTVVKQRQNGLLLDELSPDHISKALRQLYSDPKLVSDLQRGAVLTTDFGLDALGQSLRQIAESRSTG